MRDGASASHDRRDVTLVGAHAMNEERLRVEHAEPVEHVDRRAAADADVNAAAAQSVGEGTGTVGDEPLLFAALRGVNRHAEAVLSREVGRRAKEGIRDRVRRVRRNADADERRLEIAKAGDLLAEPSDRRFALRRIGTEHFLVDDAAHARFTHRAHDDAGTRSCPRTS